MTTDELRENFKAKHGIAVTIAYDSSPAPEYGIGGVRFDRFAAIAGEPGKRFKGNGKTPDLAIEDLEKSMGKP